MAAGRPREHDREKIALDMIEWAKKDDSLNLNGFCAEQLIAPSKITEWARANDEFRLAYETTKAILGRRREQGLINGTLHVKAYDLNACVYDQFLKEDKREQAKYEAELKAKEAEKIPEEIEKGFDRLINQFSGKSDLNKDDKSTKRV
jgi:hypothetical protein